MVTDILIVVDDQSYPMRIDTDVLDKQISALHTVEADMPLGESDLPHISGLCDFLVAFFRIFKTND